jgi:Saxitoxin biosynthesis operon protein SxtJ
LKTTAMKLPDSLFNPDRHTLRQFAAGWLIFFLGAGAIQYVVQHRAMAALGLSLVALIGPVLGWLAPAVLRWLFTGGMLLAFPFGWLSSQLILAVMFFGVLTPLAVIFRVVRRDRLNRFRPKPALSYWLSKNPSSDVRSYFRPY